MDKLGMRQEAIEYLNAASENLSRCQSLSDEVIQSVELCITSLQQGGCIFWAGNGGSASDAQHLAAELVGRFLLNRRALRSVALNTDTSVMTSLANDFGYETIFARQIEALADNHDVFIGITTSGTSKNILQALEKAKSMGVPTILLTSQKCGEEIADIIIRVPSDITAHIQEAHIAIGQLMCGLIEKHFFG
jgi:D-sedoheptulose 7-phosphate isomerase